MPEIAHRVEIEASPDEVYEAISSPSQLSKWWTSANEDATNADLLNFDFGGGHIVRMQVEEAVVPERVVWQCVEGPWADNGNFVFELEAIDRGTNLRFTHHGWSDTDDFFRHCNGKWGFFLAVSLKTLLEVGQGQPSPTTLRSEPNSTSRKLAEDPLSAALRIERRERGATFEHLKIRFGVNHKPVAAVASTETASGELGWARSQEPKGSAVSVPSSKKAIESPPLRENDHCFVESPSGSKGFVVNRQPKSKSKTVRKSWPCLTCQDGSPITGLNASTASLGSIVSAPPAREPLILTG